MSFITTHNGVATIYTNVGNSFYHQILVFTCHFTILNTTRSTPQFNANTPCYKSILYLFIIKLFYLYKLFSTLLERRLSPVVVRVLFDQYTRQKVRVMWDGKTSEYFPIENGVRQGGYCHPSCSRYIWTA